jgi:hypothetical protein
MNGKARERRTRGGGVCSRASTEKYPFQSEQGRHRPCRERERNGVRDEGAVRPDVRPPAAVAVRVVEGAAGPCRPERRRAGERGPAAGQRRAASGGRRVRAWVVLRRAATPPGRPVELYPIRRRQTPGYSTQSCFVVSHPEVPPCSSAACCRSPPSSSSRSWRPPTRRAAPLPPADPRRTRTPATVPVAAPARGSAPCSRASTRGRRSG